MTIDLATGETATDLPDRCHPACFAYGVRNGDGLGLRFAEESDGTVVGSFACDGKQQGYNEVRIVLGGYEAVMDTIKPEALWQHLEQRKHPQ